MNCPAEQFWNRFLASSIEWRFSHGAVDIISGHSGIELDLTQTIAMFNPLHEADQTTFEKVAADIIGSENRDNSWLKTARKINGFTQEQLSAKSGVSIRLIRAYEQEKINISNAEYSTIMRLRNALNCA